MTAIQSEYSFMERSPERNGVLKICEELGIGFVPWGPVGMVAPETAAAFPQDDRLKVGLVWAGQLIPRDRSCESTP